MNKLKPKPFRESYFIVSDIELDEKMNVSMIYSYGDFNTDLVHFNVEDYINWVFKKAEIVYKASHKKKTLTVYAHFGGGFDFLFFLNEIIKKPVFIQLVMSGSLVSALYISYKDFKINFQDSFVLFRAGLNKVAKSIIKKEKIEIDMEHRDSVSKTNMIQYCRNDCVILHESLKKFEKDLNYPLALTMPMMGMKIFRERYLKKALPKVSLWEYNTVKYEYSFAGRVDVFRRHGTDIVHVDINQAYPYAMKQYGSPIGKPRQTKAVDFKKFGFYTVKILDLNKIRENYTGFTPIRQDFKLLFGVSKVCKLTTYELMILEELNIPYKITFGMEYEVDKTFFEDFVDYFYNMRLDDPDMKFVSKLMLNSIQGKMAQRLDFEEISFTPDKSEPGQLYFNPELGLKVNPGQIKIRDYIYPAAPAAIWAANRWYLFWLLHKVHNHTYYCDTDSLAINKSAIGELSEHIHQTRLGGLKVENEYKEAYFLAPKVYGYLQTDGEFDFKFKGLDRGYKTEVNGELITAKEFLTKDKFKEMYETNELLKEFKSYNLLKFKSAVKKRGFINWKWNTKKDFTFRLKRERIDIINTKQKEL